MGLHNMLYKIEKFRRLYLVLFSASSVAQANTPSDIAQIPLSAATGVPANIIFTLDDSKSMTRAYLPDQTTASYQQLIDASATTASRRFRAAHTNPIYYNPQVIYEIPPAFTQAGVEYELTTSFTRAPVNGFAGSNDQGNVDLSQSYRVLQKQQMPAGGMQYAEHPSADFSCSISDLTSNGTLECGEKIQFAITRISESACTAHVVLAGREQAVDCSIIDNTVTASVPIDAGVPAYYYEFDGDLENGLCRGRHANQDAGGEACYRLRWVDQTSVYDKNGNHLSYPDGHLVDGRHNFAIWYSFYKTRALAALSATSIAFADVSADLRFTWQSSSACKGFTGSDVANCQNNAIKTYKKAHKGQFYSWLRQVGFNADASLPTAVTRAGEYLKTAAPWQMYLENDGANSSANTYACRPNYHVLMTDGSSSSTDDSGYPAIQNFRADESSFTLPDGKQYAAVRPYFDSRSKTLADLAMHYWATDLQPNLANNLPAYTPYKQANTNRQYWDPRNNLATWQHISHVILSLGLGRTLDDASVPWAGSTYAGAGYNKLSNGQASWSNTVAYDLWHAALNSRGELYSVENPTAMGPGFKQVLSRLIDQKDAAVISGINVSLEPVSAAQNTEQQLTTYSYQSSFNSAEGWTGDLKKIKNSSQGQNGINQEVWSANRQLPTYSVRNIMIAGAGASKLQAFNPSNAGLPSVAKSLAYYLDINPEPGLQQATWQQRLVYLRGDQSQEGDSAESLRPRTVLLGDFLSSQPVSVTGARYLQGFVNRLEGNTAYTDFARSVKTRSPMLYIGGNDGMLHGFNSASGEEKLTFIPTVVFPNLHKLTAKNYSHQYYVDGTPVVADVYDGAQWRTILVGTLRAGGKGLFALDITDPNSIKLLWELDEYSPALQNLGIKLGYSFAQPTIARLHSGQWAVVTGNGYHASGGETGAAALYLINALDGSMIKSLEVQSAIRTPNGLSTPRLADYDADGVADYAYAGDLHGNLWRFDLLGDGAIAATESPLSHGNYGRKSGSISQFKVSYGGKPMFTATSTIDAYPQPITSAPSLVRHPSRKGYLVVFGTGQYFELDDNSVDQNSAQSVYAIWDMKTKAETTAPDTIGRNQLQAQNIIDQAVSASDAADTQRAIRTISAEPVEWYTDFDSTKPVKQRGWRLDLLQDGFTGERVVENMRALGSMLLFQTLIPNTDPCSSGTNHWLYAVDPTTGGRIQHHVFNTLESSDGGAETISAIEFGAQGEVAISQNKSGLTVYAADYAEVIQLPATAQGRQTWRMVPE